jgi:hypothetical protein
MTPSSRFRYADLTQWWKGNLHVHSTRSDGGKTPAELAMLYAGAGYDFLVLTDHWVAGAPDDLPNPCPLTVLDGVELDGNDTTGAPFHVVCIGCRNGIDRKIGIEAAMAEARRQGAMLVLAHPLWTGNSTEDALRHGFDGVEVFNNVADWLNGKSSGAFHWDRMLDRSPSVVGPAVDDAHINAQHPPWNGGWVFVDAPKPAPGMLLAALKAGRFVSSRGPVIHSLMAQGPEVSVTCSPVRFIRLVGPAELGQRRAALEGPLLTGAAFTVPEEWAHVRLEIEDECGRRAWTNALFD